MKTIIFHPLTCKQDVNYKDEIQSTGSAAFYKVKQ